MISIIVAVARGGVIGADGRMPWHLPEDLRMFRKLTMGGVVVMGRKTFESIGKPLPGRTNVVITRQTDFHPEGAEVVHSLGEALEKHPDCFIIGGAEIYRQALPLADRLYMTKIKTAYKGDTIFPKTDLRRWHRLSSEDHGTFAFNVYTRKRPVK
jgi:dihydrofolate reductase